MFRLGAQERKLYEAIINHLTEEIGYLRAQIGIYSAPAAQQEEDIGGVVIPFGRAAITEPQEDLEWQLQTGRITMDEFEDEMRRMGIPIPKIEELS